MHNKDKQRVAINISGEIFETFNETLARFPTTLLGDRRRRRKYFCMETQQYFLERNRLCFESILYFYQSNGTLNCPKGISIELFDEECTFFRIPRKFINEMKKKEGIFPELLKENRTVVKHLPIRLRIWNFLEKPGTSLAAWNFGMVSLVFVWVSIVTAAMETMAGFQSNSNAWSIMELSVNVWFTFELVLRGLFSGSLSNFLKSYMNIIDILAVIPYFLLLVAELNTLANLIRVFKTLKFLRVCRLFRFSNHSKRLIVAIKILRRCFSDFRLLFTCLMIVLVLGGTSMFVVEQTPSGDGAFESIPAGLWWCVQTLSTVGYGDMIPRTMVGRVLASCFMLLGVATISLPILTIVSEFVRLYPKNIELVSNSGEEKVGGTGDSKELHLPMRSLKPIRRKASVYHRTQYS